MVRELAIVTLSLSDLDIACSLLELCIGSRVFGLLYVGLLWVESLERDSFEADSFVTSVVGLSLKSLRVDDFSLPVEPMIVVVSGGSLFLLASRACLLDGFVAVSFLSSSLFLRRPFTSCFLVLLPCPGLLRFLIHQSSNSVTLINPSPSLSKLLKTLSISCSDMSLGALSMSLSFMPRLSIEPSSLMSNLGEKLVFGAGCSGGLFLVPRRSRLEPGIGTSISLRLGSR
mmetsp:Transcript_22374/g.36316  ORF Transcript_22374/g.36316 Transcript_22374/m.36316 type:complete len:229 (-) Transcript_22374:272-958(-)